MQVYEVTLPGGLLKNGKPTKKAIFKPVTGKLEQTLIDYSLDSNRPEYVTQLLVTALDKIGDFTVNDEIISELCVADRQYLLLKLATILNGNLMWLKVCCQHCHEYFDVDLNRSELPVKGATREFPLVTINLENDVVVARVPNGNDQYKIHELPDDEAMLELLYNCIQSVNKSDVTKQFIKQLSVNEIEKIDLSLDEVAPAVCDQVLVSCPECNHEQQIRLDHSALTGIDKRVFYDEVHTLASQYHWSEDSILELPKERRRLYLELINQSSGYTV